MFERLDKMRAELERAKQRRADADAKVKTLEAKLKEAENNQIIADVTKNEASTQAVGIVIQSTTAAAEITTYDVGATTAPAPVGPGITTTMPATNPVVADQGVATSSVAVFAVLAAATLGVIIAIVVFFVIKRK